MWVCDFASGLPDGNEFENCVEKLDRALEKWLRAQKYKEGDCYYRWDFFGDRTQYLEVSRTDALDHRLIEFLQEELSDKWAMWRVAIPTPGAKGQAIMIYPEIVRIWGEGTAPLSELLQKTRAKMR